MPSLRSKGPRFAIALVASLCVVTHDAASGQTRTAPLAPPGETGRRITEDGLLANYFPARRRGPALLALGGSVGGLSPDMNNTAKALQAEGFGVLHLSYFRGPGQPAGLELIPLEYFATALAWLRRQPEVDATRMAILGASRGAEAALLVALRHPELKAVIAALPSSAVWPGIPAEESDGAIGGAWSESGKPVPHMPPAPYDARSGGTMADNFTVRLRGLPEHPEAVIPVEKLAGRLLLVCGEADQVWPSCPMARQIEQRLRDHGRPAPILLAYRDAGHLAFGLPVPPDDPRLATVGGTAEGTNAARSDSWSRAIAFLKATLKG